MPLLAIGAIGAGTSLLGGLFGSSASEEAAEQQEQAEQQGINLLQGAQQTGLSALSPYETAGGAATTSLSSLLGTPGQGLLAPWTQSFTPLTGAQVEQTPGYQFQEQQGLQAAQNSAAGQGSLLSGRTLASLNNYAQGTANSAYQQYGVEDPLLQYQSAYNTFLNNQNNSYSRLMGLSGEGLTATQSGNNLLSNLSGDTASLLGAKGAAAAAGTIGSANAWTGALGGASNSLQNSLLLNQLSGNSAFQSPSTAENINSIPIGNGSMPFSSLGTPAAPYSPFQLPSTGSTAVPQFADGTDFAPGGPSIVGERGPEMVNLPQGAQVVPNNQLSSLNGTAPMVPRAPIASPYQPVAQPVSNGGAPVGTPAPYRPMPIPQPSPVSPVGGTPSPYRPSPYPMMPNPYMAQQQRFPLSALSGGARAF